MTTGLTRGPMSGAVQEYYLTKMFESTPTDPILLNGFDGNTGYAAFDRLLDQNSRATLSDFRPDPRTMESDQARDTRAYAVQFLNHRFHGSRSGDQHPDMPEIFTELTDLDPRGTATDPDMNQMRRQAWAREERTRQNLYPEGPDFVTSGGWAPESVQQGKITMRNMTRERMRYFFPEELQEALGPRRQFTFAEHPYANRPLAEMARPTLGADSVFGSRMGGARARVAEKKREWSELDSRAVDPDRSSATDKFTNGSADKSSEGMAAAMPALGRHNRRTNARSARAHMIIAADSAEDTGNRMSSQLSAPAGRSARHTDARRPDTDVDNYSRNDGLNDGFEPRGRGAAPRHQDSRAAAGMTTSTAYTRSAMHETTGGPHGASARHQDARAAADMTTSTAYTRSAMHETTGGPHGASARHQDGRRAAAYVDADAPDVQRRVAGEHAGRHAMMRTSAARSGTGVGMQSEVTGAQSRVGDRESAVGKRRARTEDLKAHRADNQDVDVRDRTRVGHAYTRMHATPQFRPCREGFEETNWNDMGATGDSVHKNGGGTNGLMGKKEKTRFRALEDSEVVKF